MPAPSVAPGATFAKPPRERPHLAASRSVRRGLCANRAARLTNGPGQRPACPHGGASTQGCAVADCGVCKLVYGLTRAAAGSPFWCCYTASARPATYGMGGGPCSLGGGRG